MSILVHWSVLAEPGWRTDSEVQPLAQSRKWNETCCALVSPLNNFVVSPSSGLRGLLGGSCAACMMSRLDFLILSGLQALRIVSQVVFTCSDQADLA